jgi:hypothetical protein
LTGTPAGQTVASHNAENLDQLDPAGRFTAIAAEVVNRLKPPDIIVCRKFRTTDGASNPSTEPDIRSDAYSIVTAGFNGKPTLIVPADTEFT